METQCHLPQHDEQVIRQIEKAVGVSPLVAKLLYNREFRDANSVREFLDAPLKLLQPAEALAGVDDAATIIADAIRSNKRIFIYGDYDADGMTGTAILFSCIELLGGNVGYFIPSRLDDGYGLNNDALKTLKERGADLIVTVDCGIASLAEADFAKQLGIDLVVTDHHRMAERLPTAAAIVHPDLPGAKYPHAPLCGSGVAFKVAWRIFQKFSDSEKVASPHRDFLMQAIGIAAIGTVADVVPLVGENRVIVRHGLISLKLRPVEGLRRLFKYSAIEQKPAFESEDIGFVIAPRLNAAGRLGQAQLGVELLTTKSPDRAETLAEYIQNLNQSREKIERSLIVSANKQIAEKFDAQSDPAFVLDDRGWHLGVIGIVAGKIADKYKRPTVVVSFDESGLKQGVGSARSAGAINLYDAFSACQIHLDGFGGHAAAAGMRIDEKNIDAFRCDFLEYVASNVPPEMRGGSLKIDAQAMLGQLNIPTLLQIEQLAPFGNSNPRPLFCSIQVDLANCKKIGKGERHLSVVLKQGGVTIRGVAFGMADWADELNKLNSPIDVVYKPVINDFNGRKRAEIHLVDWRMSEQPSVVSN